MKRRPSRKSIQVLSLIAVVLVPFLNKNGVTFITGSLYSFSIVPVWITDPLTGLQAILLSLTIDWVLLLSMIVPLLVALAFGRVFCSWVCPQNTLSEFIDWMSGLLGIKKIFKFCPSVLPRYFFLAFVIIMTPLAGIPLASFLSAPGIISVQAANYMYRGIAGLELGLIGLIALGELFFARRVWCANICPVGSFLGLFRTRKTLKVVFREDEEHACGKCAECVRACRLGLDPLGQRLYPLCDNCGECVDACAGIKAEKKPLSFRF